MRTPTELTSLDLALKQQIAAIVLAHVDTFLYHCPVPLQRFAIARAIVEGKLPSSQKMGPRWSHVKSLHTALQNK